MKTIFLAKAKSGRLEFKNQEQVFMYLQSQEDKDLIITIDQKRQIGPKQRMYAYYHGPLLQCFVYALSQEGWEAVDQFVADNYVKFECAKSFAVNKHTGETFPTLEDKSSMTQERLAKFISDAIHLLETRHNIIPPDSQEYKELKALKNKKR